MVPAWRRLTDGEERWPATVAVLSVITFQVRLPDQLTLTSPWVMPGIEAVILATLVAMNPAASTGTRRSCAPSGCC